MLRSSLLPDGWVTPLPHLRPSSLEETPPAKAPVFLISNCPWAPATWTSFLLLKYARTMVLLVPLSRPALRSSSVMSLELKHCLLREAFSSHPIQMAFTVTVSKWYFKCDP